MERADRNLDIQQSDYPGGIKIWASNPAILWTRVRPERKGLHVHIYKKDSEEKLEDDTFDRVIVDGHEICESMARHLMAQQALLYLKDKIVSLSCSECGKAHFDKDELAFRPHKKHECEYCEATFVTPGRRRLVVSNPIISTFRILRNAAVITK